MHLSFGSQQQEYMEINLTIYKPIVEKSLSVLNFKVFVKNKRSRSDMQHYTYMKKNSIIEHCLRTLVQMKDSLLIDSKLSTQFLAKAIDTANYLQNRLPTKRIADNTVIIPDKAQIEVRQSLKHVQIFGSRVSTHIFFKKCSKSDIYIRPGMRYL